MQRAKEAMQVSDDVIRVGISPMTPPQVFLNLWTRIQKIYPDMKFKLITFENTLENAREILANMGQNIDVVAGIFDETMLKFRGCDGTEILLDDLVGEDLMLMQRGWSYYGDLLRDDISRNHPLIKIIPVKWDYTMSFGILHSKIKDDNLFYTDDLYRRYISYNYPQWHIKEYETVHDTFEEDVENCLEAGRNAHMAKPLDVKIITTIIAKYCAKKK